MSEQHRKLAYSISELAEMSGVGRTFLYEEIGLGRLVVTKAGRRSLILYDDALAWIAALPKLKRPAAVKPHAEFWPTVADVVKRLCVIKEVEVWKMRNERFYTEKQIAECLGVSSRTVRRWIHDKLLIAHRIKGVVRIAANDFAAFLAAQRED